MCWPWSFSRQRTSVSVSSANQSMRSPTDQIPALLIQPPRLVEVPTSGDTVTTRAATSGASRSRSTQKRPNACWVDSRPRCSRPSDAGTAGGSRSSTGSRRSRAAASAHSRRLRRVVLEAGPRVVRIGAQHGRQLGELLGREQRRVVGRMALGRQPPALDRVGEHDARAVAHLVGRPEAVDQRAEVVAAEVAERGQQIGVVAGEHRRPRAAAAARRRPPAGAAGTPRWASRRCARAARAAAAAAGRT